MVLVKTSETVKILNFDKLQSPKFNSFKDMTGFLRLNYENINLQKDIRNSRCLMIDSSLFHGNQMNFLTCHEIVGAKISTQESVGAAALTLTQC